MSDTPSVSVLFITYNRLWYTQLALHCIVHNTNYPNFNVHIVDNGSSESGMKDYLLSMKKRFPEIIHSVTMHPKNMGLSRVTNAFWKSTTSDYVSKVDNDSLVHWNWLPRLMAGALKINKPCVLAANHFARCGHFDLYQRDGMMPRSEKINGQTYVPASWVGGCCYIMRRDCISVNGHLEEGIGKVYGWDRWQQRAREKGVVVGYVWPFVLVDHMDEDWHPLNGKKTIYKDYSAQIQGFRKNPQEDAKL